MNRDEARTILQSARAGGQDAADPQVSEALRLASSDPVLAQEWNAQRAFDSTMVAGTKSIPVPGHLKDSILAARKIVRPHFWQDWRSASVAAAATLALLAGGVWYLRHDAGGFTEFRRALIEDRGSLYARLDYASTDPAKVREWLASQGAPTEFSVPPGLQEWRLQGCSVLHQDGRKVSMLALGNGQKRLNLFVLQGTDFEDLPSPGAPDFEKCGVWKTASWQQGSTTYVLNGLKLQSFVSKFRKSGRWTILDRGDGAGSPTEPEHSG